MGILNITPDSFYDGRSSIDINSNREKLKKLLASDIIDVGCESSRPGSIPISSNEEIRRLDTFIPLLKEFPKKIYSIDTSKYKVAKYAIENGFTIINDISAGEHNSKIFELVSKYHLKIILMHMLGSPRNMQNNPKYKSIIDEIISFFNYRIKVANKYGIDKSNIIIDPGIGFGKTIAQNDQIINNLDKFTKIGCPLLLGLSRKSFLQYKKDTPKERLHATMGVTALAVQKGINIIRVHDVEDTISMLNSVERILS